MCFYSFLKLQRALINAQQSLSHFMNNTWTIKNENFLHLNSLLSESEFYDFGIKELYPNYVDYGKLCLLGARRYLLHWSDEGIARGKIIYNRLVLIDKILKYVFFFGLFWFLYNRYFSNN